MPLKALTTAAVTALALLGTAGAGATDVTALSPAERDAFRAEVRDYLLEHPEVLLEAIRVLESRQQAAETAGEQALIADNAKALFEDGHSFVAGNPEGDVTLVEFFDYRCGFCRRAHPEVAELLTSDGNIRLIAKEFPILGEDSVASARLAIATLRIAGPEAYRALHDALMTLRGPVDARRGAHLLEELGHDPAPILAEMESEAVSGVIAENRALAQRLGISGTPTFVLGDKMLRGYMPLEQMRELVAETRERSG